MRRILLLLLIVGALPAMRPLARAQALSGAAPGSVPVASITAVLHSGLLLRAGAGHLTAAAPFMPLFTGDRLRTTGGQHNAILVRDGAQFLLNENTDLGIAYPILRLYHGEIYGRIPHSGSFHVVVRTDAAVAAVQGTEFDIRTGAGGGRAMTVLTVVVGSVQLSNALGSVLVQAGQQSTASANTAPTQPIVVPLVGIARWTQQVQFITTIALPPHYPTPRAAGLAAAAARARLAGHPQDIQATLSLADALADQGAALTAQQLYRVALALLPAGDNAGRARAETGIAATAFARGDLATAAAAASAALALNPASLQAGLLQGDVALARGDFSSALSVFQALHTRYPQRPDPLVASGLVLLLQRHDASAGSLLQAALSRHPPPWLKASALIDLGALATFAGTLDVALAYDLRAVSADPHSPIGWVGVGSTLGELGRYQEALQPLTIATRLGTSFEQALAFNDLGEARYELGQTPEELVAYQAALARNPQDAVAAHGVGTAELELGQTEQAVTYLRRAVLLAPALGDLSADYGRALWAAHQDAQAERVCRIALRTDPQNPALYLVLGYALEDEGRPGDARSAYAAAYTLRPHPIRGAEDARFAGELAFYAGHTAEASADLQRSTALHPASYRAWELLGLVLERSHHYQQAIAAAVHAVALNPTDSVSHDVLALSYVALGDDLRAAAEDRIILKLNPDQPGVHAGLGLIAERRGDLAAARDEFLSELRIQHEPINRGPGLARALATDWAALGLIYDELHKPQDGAAAYLQALRYSPRHGAYYRSLGLDQQALGQASQALASFSAAIAIDGHDAAAYFFKGNLELLLGQLPAAGRDLRQAVTLDPRDGPSRLLLGNLFVREGNYASAREQFQVAVTLLKGAPLEAVAWAALGNALDNLHSLKEAIAAYRQAVALDPHNTLVHRELGFDLLNIGQLDAARAELLIVIAQDPKDSFGYLDLALVDEQQGHTSKALAELQQQIAVNAGMPRVLAVDYRVLGLIHGKHLRWDDAVRAFEQVIAYGSGTDQDYYDLGYALEQQGDKLNALVNLRKAHDLALAAGHTDLAATTCKELVGLGAHC